MTGHIRVAGAWKDLAGASVKVGGVWKTVEKGFTRVGGVWKEWLVSETDLVLVRFLASTGSVTYFVLQDSNSNTYHFAQNTSGVLGMAKISPAGVILWHTGAPYGTALFHAKLNATETEIEVVSRDNFHRVNAETGDLIQRVRFSGSSTESQRGPLAAQRDGTYMRFVYTPSDTTQNYGRMFNSNGTWSFDNRRVYGISNTSFQALRSRSHLVNQAGDAFAFAASVDDVWRGRLAVWNSSGTLRWQRRTAQNTIRTTTVDSTQMVSDGVHVWLLADDFSLKSPGSVVLRKIRISDGAQIWAKGLRREVDVTAGRMALDALGNIYLVQPGPTIGADYYNFILKIDTNGNLVWVRETLVSDSNLGSGAIQISSKVTDSFTITVARLTLKLPTSGTKTGTYSASPYGNVTYRASTYNWTISDYAFNEWSVSSAGVDTSGSLTVAENVDPANITTTAPTVLSITQI